MQLASYGMVWVICHLPTSTTMMQFYSLIAMFGFVTVGFHAGYAVYFPELFPHHLRATGTGFAIGVGRGGAVLAPVAAGYLFHAGFALQTVALAMASGSLLAAVALLALRVRDAD